MKHFRLEAERGKGFVVRTPLELATLLIEADSHGYKWRSGHSFTDTRFIGLRQQLENYGKVTIFPKKGTHIADGYAHSYPVISFKVTEELPGTLELLSKIA